VVKKRDEQRLEAAHMKFLRHLLGITTSDQERNQSVREKLGVRNTVLEIQQYQRKWQQHPQSMDISRLPKQAPKYKRKAKSEKKHKTSEGKIISL
jgi:glucan-binding YG repeat protein